MTVDPGVVRVLAPEQLPAAAAVLAAAFATDPYTVGLLPAGRRDERLRRLFVRVVREGMTGGVVHGLYDGARLLGVAVWERPGKRPSWRMQLAGVLDYLRVFGGRVVDAARSDAAARRHRPRVAHWYLKGLGTTPEARGRGVGSTLVRHALELVDREDAPAYLEASTEDNVPFYRHLGFVPTVRIPSPGTVPCVGMWRSARL